MPTTSPHTRPMLDAAMAAPLGSSNIEYSPSASRGLPATDVLLAVSLWAAHANGAPSSAAEAASGSPSASRRSNTAATASVMNWHRVALMPPGGWMTKIQISHNGL
eukprot:328527-Chlamydomonas_euryale.AAC.1